MLMNKKRIIFMITIGLFFIAACTVLLVVSSHSTLLINETIKTNTSPSAIIEPLN